MEIQQATSGARVAGPAVAFGRFLAVRAVLTFGGAAVGSLGALVFVPGGGWAAAEAGATVGAFGAVTLSLVAVGGGSGLGEALEDIAGFVIAFGLATAACAAAGAAVGLMVVSWHGWGIVPLSAGVGALVPLMLILALGGADPGGFFREIYRGTRQKLHAVGRRRG